MRQGRRAVWLTQHGDKKRRDHEVTLRELDHGHDHRERLQRERLVAYRRFASAWMNMRRVHEHLGTATTVHNIWMQHDEQERPLSPEFNRTEAGWRATLLDSLATHKELEDALASLEFAGDIDCRP